MFCVLFCPPTRCFHTLQAERQPRHHMDDNMAATTTTRERPMTAPDAPGRQNNHNGRDQHTASHRQSPASNPFSEEGMSNWEQQTGTQRAQATASSSSASSARLTNQRFTGSEGAGENVEPVGSGLPLLPPALLAAKGKSRWGLDAGKVELRPGEPMVRVGFPFL